MLTQYPKLKFVLVLVGLIMVPITIIAPTSVILSAKKNSTSISSTRSYSTTFQPITTTITTTVLTSSASTTTSPCSSPCTESQICFNDTCLGTGNLGISVMWSRTINGDINVQTPNGNDIAEWSIYPQGPSEYTDYGQLDVISKLTGPENIFWDTNTETPYGTYNVCLEFYFIEFGVDAVGQTNPIIATVYVRKPSVPTQIFTRTFTSFTDGIYICNIDSAGYIASFNYP